MLRAFVQFLVPWSAFVALVSATVLLIAWLSSSDGDAMDEQIGSMFLWSFLWRPRWLYSRVVGKKHALAGPTGNGRQFFRTVRSAKDYLAEKIAAEALLAGTPLSDVERKMLYFSETAWTLPEMKQVSAEFDRDYDDAEYEQKIGGLIGNIEKRLELDAGPEHDRWNLAWQKLSRGDHYLLVLVGQKNVIERRGRRPLRMLLIAFLLVVFAVADLYLRNWMRQH